MALLVLSWLRKIMLLLLLPLIVVAIYGKYPMGPKLGLFYWEEIPNGD